MNSLTLPDWRPGPARPSARPGHIDIWRIRLGPAAAGAERPQAGAAMRTILASYLGVTADALRIARAAGGKPYLAAPATDLGFNLSHTRTIAVLAVSSDSRIGVDVECRRPLHDLLRTARRVMPDELLQRIVATPCADRERCFFLCWTQLEAAQKAFGHGIFAAPVPREAYALRQFQVSAGCVASVACAPPHADLHLRYFDDPGP